MKMILAFAALLCLAAAPSMACDYAVGGVVGVPLFAPSVQYYAAPAVQFYSAPLVIQSPFVVSPFVSGYGFQSAVVASPFVSSYGVGAAFVGRRAFVDPLFGVRVRAGLFGRTRVLVR